jgi:hypothetical protein
MAAETRMANGNQLLTEIHEGWYQRIATPGKPVIVSGTKEGFGLIEGDLQLVLHYLSFGKIYPWKKFGAEQFLEIKDRYGAEIRITATKSESSE